MLQLRIGILAQRLKQIPGAGWRSHESSDSKAIGIVAARAGNLLQQFLHMIFFEAKPKLFNGPRLSGTRPFSVIAAVLSSESLFVCRK